MCDDGVWIQGSKFNRASLQLPEETCHSAEVSDKRLAEVKAEVRCEGAPPPGPIVGPVGASRPREKKVLERRVRRVCVVRGAIKGAADRPGGLFGKRELRILQDARDAQKSR